MFVCLESLLSCGDNYVVFLCTVSLLTFLMSVCRESLLYCGDNSVVFYVLCHCLRF